MDTVTRLMSLLLRRLVRVLPAHRRDWGEAVLAEAGEVPDPAGRLAWVVGGVWLVLRETRLPRGLLYVLGATAGGAGVVMWGWHGGSTNPGAPVDRAGTIAVVLVLIGLPWLGRWRGVFGPAGADRGTRVVRAGGYLAVWALLGTMVYVSRFAGARFDDRSYDNPAEMITGSAVGAVFTVGLLGTYLGAILSTTRRRSRVGPRALRIGAGAGVLTGLVGYGLTPFGNLPRITPPWLAAGYVLVLLIAALGTPVLAGWLAARGPSVHDNPELDDDARIRRGIVAGLWTSGMAALVCSVCTVITMVRFPGRVALIWANPDPNVPHGTVFELRMTVGDTAGKYLVLLVLAPIVGLIGGLIGGSARRPVGEP